MFNLSGSEIVVILLLALIVIGPDKLPDAMRRAGKTFAEIKKLSSGFQDEVRKGFEDPVREVKQTAATIKSAASFPIDTTASVKPRYNPATDPVPKPPEGSSVAEPLTDITAEVTADAIEAVDDAPAADAIDVSADADADASTEATEPTEADRTA